MTRGKIDDTLAVMFSSQEYSKDYLFYAHIIGQCSIVIDHDLPAPAGVSFQLDHYNLYINPKQFDVFPLLHRLGVLKHEMLHVIFDHIHRLDSRECRLWNYATDLTINQMIELDHLPETDFIPDVLSKIINKPIPLNKSAEFYYELLKDSDILKDSDDKKSSGEGKESGEGKGSGEGKESGEPKGHEKWEESVGDPDLQRDVTKNMVERAQQSTIKSNGNVPNACSDWLSMLTRKAELNWKRVLRGIVGNKKVNKRTTISRRDRRFPHRDDLRGKVRDRTFNLLVVADVSGSMSDKAVIRTLSEVRHVCDVTKTSVNLIQVDSVAYQPEILTKKTSIIDRKGSGGTDLRCAIDMAKSLDYQAIVVLSDGYVDESDVESFNKTNKRVIWLIESDGVVPDGLSSRSHAFKLKP